MKYLMLILLASLLVSCGDTVHMEETDYEGRPHILVKTRSLKYFYDIRGGGFSRILDRKGKEIRSLRKP